MKKYNKGCKVLGWITAGFALMAFIGLMGEGADFATSMLLILMAVDSYYLINR